MERFKRYLAASTMGVIALVCVLVGVIGLTLLRPPTQQNSSVVSSTDLIMTRDTVLSIVQDDVSVTATSASGANVTLSYGTPQDVRGWIGDAAYTEVVGLEADRNRLKAEVHEATPTVAPTPSPSVSPAGDAQSGAQSGATVSDLASELAASDMWFEGVSGAGTVRLDLTDVPGRRSVLAASSAGANDLILTLTWQTEQTNTLAIVSFLAAAVFALIAVALFLTRWQLLRHRKVRAQRLEERRKADSLETGSINSAEVAQRLAQSRTQSSSQSPERDHKDDAADTVREGSTPGDDASRDEEQHGEELSSGEEEQGEDETPAERRSLFEREVSADIEDGGDPLTDTFERRGRHGLDAGPIDQDPPERATTDTGVIDLSGIRGGRTLPSRRALREARNNGEETVVVDGQEFNTGLIPVTRSPKGRDSQVPTSAPDDDASSTGEWTSIMSGWLSEDEGGKK